MKDEFKNILVIQTAFIGDAVLTLPLMQVLKKFFPAADIDVVVVPRSADVFRNHPGISSIIEYDKRGNDRGVARFYRVLQALRAKRYDLAMVPHRSLRSALLARLANIPLRIGFNRNSGRILLSTTVPYRNDLHEIERNLCLLQGLGTRFEGRELPNVYPSDADLAKIDRVLSEQQIMEDDRLIGIAPGTIWNTKRWLKERFSELARALTGRGFHVVLIGGKEDRALCGEILASSGKGVFSAAGTLSLLESAEMIRRCRVLVTNDSAPMHLAVAMRTPVVAIFGATVPEFGFAPYGKYDIVVETKGLDCRPCSIHGGDECPIRTFVCMKNITYQRVYEAIEEVLEKAGRGGG